MVPHRMNHSWLEERFSRADADEAAYVAHPNFHPRSPVMGSKERPWFERQSQQALLWSELRGSRKVTPKKVFLIGQHSDGFTGADLVSADPAGLEDQSWRNTVSQQVQRIEPDLLVVLFQCTGVSPLQLADSARVRAKRVRSRLGRDRFP